MADKQYDIWNDDDGETEAKKSRGSRRILFFGLVLALVLAVVLVAAYRDGTGFDALRRYFSYRNQTDGEQVVYPYEASSQNHFAALGEHLVVLSNTNLSILGPPGTEVWSQAVNFAAPALVQAGERAVAYDVGGTELYLLDGDGELMHLSADEAEPLIAANLSEDGWLTVTSQKQTRKGWVRVYDPSLELVSEFKSSERFVTDACVVDGKHLAAVTLGQEAGTFVSNIVLYNLEKAGEVEPAADYDVEDGLVAAIAEQDGRILTVSDTCLTIADPNGEVQNTYSYASAYLRGYDLGGDGFAALLLNRYRSGSVGRLVTVGEDGEEIASLEVTKEVLDLSAAGRYLAVLYTDSLVVYNEDLQAYATYEGTDYASGVLMRPDGSALMLSRESASLFLP